MIKKICLPIIISSLTIFNGCSLQNKNLSFSIINSVFPSAILRYKLYKKDPDLYFNTRFFIKNSKLAIIGNVKNSNLKLEAMKSALELENIKEIYENISINKTITIHQYIQNSCTELYSMILILISNPMAILKSNYIIKVFDQNFYIFYFSNDKEELIRLVNIFKKMPNIRKIIISC